jgi:hypothetical protein
MGGLSVDIARLDDASWQASNSRVHNSHAYRLVSAIILTIVFIVSYVGIAIAVIVMAAVFNAARFIDMGWRTLHPHR